MVEVAAFLLTIVLFTNKIKPHKHAQQIAHFRLKQRLREKIILNYNKL